MGFFKNSVSDTVTVKLYHSLEDKVETGETLTIYGLHTKQSQQAVKANSVEIVKKDNPHLSDSEAELTSISRLIGATLVDFSGFGEGVTKDDIAGALLESSATKTLHQINVQLREALDEIKK